MTKLISGILILFFSHPAVSALKTLPADDPLIDEKVRQRQYLGGVDEENLKVQKELPVASRKIDRRSVHKQVFDSLEEASKEEATEEEAKAKTEKTQ